MESKMLINDRTIKTDCDKNRDNNIKTTAPINIINLNIIHEKLNKSYSTSTTTRPMENNSTTTTTTTTHNDDHFNNETINGNSQKIEKFVCDFALMSFCGSNEQNLNDIKKDLENESDREQDDEIFYDSTTESEDYESDANRNLNDIKNEEETLNSNGEQNEGLSKLYLEDNEIVSKGEEQTVTEILNAAEEDKLMDQNGRLRVVFGVIFRLIYPLTNGLVQRVKGIKDVRFLKVVHYVASSRVALTDLFAYVANTIALNLSSVQVTNRIGPILKLLKIRVSRDGIESLPDSQTKLPEAESLRTPFPSLTDPTVSHFSREPRYSLPNFQCSVKNISLEEYEATTKCCTLNILAEPPADQPIRADIVFIHGLNGSLANTWKQGLWENERRPVEFQRPPKPAVRPPKRPRHSRTSALHPPHHKKRARFSHADVSQRYWHEIDAIDETDENNYSSMVSDSNCVQTYDDIEYSFPTFRLRIHDNGRLLQAEHDFNNKSGNIQSPDDVQNSRIVEKGFDKKPLKPSPNDPNYSKCWPGDWLPIDCPGVRVIALNYTTDPHLFRPLWKKKQARSNLIQRSREMMDLLIKYRVGYGHPIVWVGHSKGGLFIKQIIVDAWESGRPAVAPFWRSARGVFFYSVPHRGSHLASIRTPFLIRSVELIDIEKNNKYLLDLHRRFVGLYHLGHLKIEVFSFVETALTLMSLLYLRIVGVDSADPGIGDVCGIRLDHREICKPRNRDCILYKQLVDMINKVS